MPAMNPDQPSLDIEDHAALAKYLRESRGISTDALTFQTLAGGVSNKTVLVNFPDGHGWVIKQALAKLRTKADWFSDPARVHREALGIRWLSKLVPGSIPEFVFEDFEHHLLTMHAVPQPHENWKTMLLAGDVNHAYFAQFGMLLAEIHRRSIEHRKEVQTAFADTGFFESLRIEPYYSYTAGQVPEAKDFLRNLVGKTRERRIALTHGDFSPKNILVHEGKLILLDHEVIHWGDPAFDVGFAMAHILSKALHVRAKRQEFLTCAKIFWRGYTSCFIECRELSFSTSAAVDHSLACLLARVAGRSPLEYLDERERAIQRAWVVDLMRNHPSDMRNLIKEFAKRMSSHANN